MSLVSVFVAVPGDKNVIGICFVVVPCDKNVIGIVFVVASCDNNVIIICLCIFVKCCLQISENHIWGKPCRYSGFIYIDTQGTDSLLEEERKTKLKGFMETDRQKL
jgi:hypothetical protein